MELAVAKVYGQALFDAALECDKVDEIKEETEQLNSIFHSEEQFYQLLINPSLSVIKKKELINSVFEGRLCSETLSFLYILVDKGRFAHYEEICKEFQRLSDQTDGLDEGVVYSAYPLSKQQIAKLEEETGKLLDKEVKLVNSIDKTVIGGVKIMTDDKLIDASIRSRLDRLHSKIKDI